MISFLLHKLEDFFFNHFYYIMSFLILLVVYLVIAGWIETVRDNRKERLFDSFMDRKEQAEKNKWNAATKMER